MRFVETPIFTREITRVLSDDEYLPLQLTLAANPAQGAIIRGSGGMRKIRWSKSGSGKRGGLRVIYYWEPLENVVYLLWVYRKAEQSDLDHGQLRELSALVKEMLH